MYFLLSRILFPRTPSAVFSACPLSEWPHAHTVVSPRVGENWRCAIALNDFYKQSIYSLSERMPMKSWEVFDNIRTTTYMHSSFAQEAVKAVGGGVTSWKDSYTYEDIISVENLLEAWREFVKGKRKRTDVQEFERYLMTKCSRTASRISTRHIPTRRLRTFQNQ